MTRLEVGGRVGTNSCLRKAISPWYESGKVSQSSVVHTYPKLLLFLSWFLLPGLDLLAEGPGELTLIYQVNKEKIEISGFEKNSPYFLENGEKVFPESGGSWYVEGDFDNLKRYAYLPDRFSLDLMTLNFKERKYPKAYWVVIRRDTIPQRPSPNSYLYWDASKPESFIAVGAWIGSKYSRANFAYVDKDFLQDFSTVRLGRKVVGESNKRGYPAFWLLDPVTLQVKVPQRDTHNEKARLNWLMKAGSDQEVIEAWNSNSSSVKYTNDEVNPLHLMALYGRENLLSSMPGLEKLSKLRDHDGSRETPGHYAARVGNQSFLKLLEQPKPAVSSSNNDGYFPVHLAIQYGHLELTRWLVETFDLKNNRRMDRVDAPILMALNSRRHEIFDYLVKLKPRKVSIQRTSLSSFFSGLCLFGRTSMVRYCLQNYNPELVDNLGRFDAIASAIRSGNPEVLSLVLDEIRKLGFSKPETKLTYLHLAALHNEAEMIPLLIEKGIPVDAVTISGVSPLYLAVTSGGLEATLKLIEYGANPDLAPADGVSAIWAATYLGNRDEIQALIESGASCELNPDFANTMVEYATLYDVAEVVQIALDQCLAPDYQLYEDFSGIYVADYFGSDGVRQLLEAHGQKLNENAKPKLISPGKLDSPIRFLEQANPDYPEEMAEKYGTLETNVWAIFNKEGKLILPKFEPALPPDVTKHMREIFKQWRIVPPLSGGQPANIRAKIPFKLERTVKKAEIFEISDLLVPPKPIKKVEPVYPPELKLQRVQSIVHLVFIVLEDGSVDDVRVRGMGSPAFVEAAIEAVKQWKFEPGIKDGRPVRTQVNLPIYFSLRR